VPSRKQTTRKSRIGGMAVERVREQTARAGDRVAAAAATARDIARRARHTSAARARDLGSQARERVSASLGPMLGPHLCFVASPRRPIPPVIMSDIVRVATYNVHRWQGVNGRTKPDVARAGFVISELDADIIALQEVENLAILERLRTDYLDEAGYLPAILIEGHDLRGIDVAFLSKLPLVGEPTLHPFPKEGIEKARYDDTRGILEATFRMPDDSLLTGFAVHFPAPFHPTEMRVIAYEQLNELRSALPRDRMAFAAGDFNTTAREDLEKNILQRFARGLWVVVNDQGCSGCEGTYYYAPDDSWSYLDLILWSPAEISGEDATWSIRAGSFAIANAGPGQRTAERRPAHFESPGGHGVSDHWPVIVALELK